MRCLLLELRACDCGWQVSCWVRAALEEDGDSEDAPQIVDTLRREKVRGKALLGLTYERLVGTPYNIAAGPAQNLADRINAMLAPTAATGFQAGSCKSGCPSCFADASERGVSPRLEVGGHLFAFALALQVAVTFRLLCP